MTDLVSLKRELEHLSVLVEIKSRQDEQDREDALILLLLGFLATYFEDGDITAFRDNVLAALENAYLILDENEEFLDLIDAEAETQATYLNGFLADLEHKKISEAQARARIKQYASSLGKVRELIDLNSMGLTTRGRWQRNPALENCPDCLELDGQVHEIQWYITTGHTPKSEMQRCGHNCGCIILPV